MSNQIDSNEVYTLEQPYYGRKATGSYEFSIAGEPMFVKNVSIVLVNGPIHYYMGCQRSLKKRH